MIKNYPWPLLKTIAVHMACWGLLIFYELGTLFYYSGKLEPAYIYVSYYAVNISFFYGALYIFSALSGRLLKLLLLGLWYYLVLFAAYFLVKFTVEYLFEFSGGGFLKELGAFRKNIVITIYRGIYFTLLAIFYWLAGHVASYRKKAADAEHLKMISLKDSAELEARLADARSAYLQQQLSPHLLFNALNFIYSSVYKSSPEASRCVLLLSDIMRSSLEETGPDGKIGLAEEISQLRRLEEINRFRFDHELSFSMTVVGDIDCFRIIPLILFTLVENIFKHGDLGDTDHPAKVIISVNAAGMLHFFTSNSVRHKTSRAKTVPIGMQNVQVRLDLSYPAAYKLTVGESAGVFELQLTLQL